MFHRVQTGLSFCMAGAAGLLLSAGFASQSADPLASVTVHKTYSAEDFGTVEVAGACTITPDTVTCWDDDGKPSPDLSEKVKAYYIVNSNAEVRYRFGRKNRVIVIKKSGTANGRAGYLTPAENGIYSSGQIGQNSSGNEPYYEWYAIDVDPNATTTSLAFNLSLSFGTGGVILREGAEVKVGAMTVHVDSIKPAPDRPVWGRNGLKQKAWTIGVTIKGFPSAVVPNMNGQLFDTAGNVIPSVDASGNPASNSAMFSGGMGNRSRTFEAGPSVVSGSGSSKQELFIGVNPGKVGSILFSPSGTRKVTFTGIPLDPWRPLGE